MRVLNYLQNPINQHLLYFNQAVDGELTVAERMARQSQAVFNFIAMLDPGLNKLSGLGADKAAMFQTVRGNFSQTMLFTFYSLEFRSQDNRQTALGDVLLTLEPYAVRDLLELGVYDHAPIMGGGRLRAGPMQQPYAKAALEKAQHYAHWEFTYDHIRSSAA